jgi:hypothetical protein
MERDQMDRKRGWWALAVVMVMVVICAYPLSLGPIYWLANHGGLPPGALAWIRVVYSPLGWVLHRIPEDLSGWYMNYLAWCAHVNDPYGPSD